MISNEHKMNFIYLSVTYSTNQQAFGHESKWNLLIWSPDSTINESHEIPNTLIKHNGTGSPKQTQCK